MKIGSLFTGIGGLELGVCDTVASISPYGNNIEWIAETDGGALKILEHSTMFCGVPNLGDVTKIDWTTVPDVDCITGGTPCQDFSYLGNACTPQQASEAFYHGLLQLTRERTSR